LSTKVRWYKCPTPWSWKLICHVDKKMISEFPPHGTSNWHWVCKRVR
jgi:hypothetical protein